MTRSVVAGEIAPSVSYFRVFEIGASQALFRNRRRGSANKTAARHASADLIVTREYFEEPKPQP